MPVRKIPKNYRCVTGSFSSKKMGTPILFESTLERDFLYLCEFDNRVISIEEQPVKIEYIDEEEKDRRYTPDFLIQITSSDIRYRSKPTWLCEIKYREDIHQQWPELRVKFKAANQYANARGWKFRVITEKLIRTAYLENARFLIPYRTLKNYGDTHLGPVLNAMQKLKETTPAKILDHLTKDRWKQAEILPALWHAVANGLVQAPIYTKQLSMECTIKSMDKTQAHKNQNSISQKVQEHEKDFV